MPDPLAETIVAFDAALARFRAGLAESLPDLEADLFKDTAEWRALLTYKLIPHLAGEGCLVAVVTGGTNTGKSTIFNTLLGEEASPVRATAAATSHPVLSANPSRARQCLAGQLVPEFQPVLLTSQDAVLRVDGDERALFIHETNRLSDRLILLDTPDVDSVVTRNWEVADLLRAAGDVLIAVVTPEKYQDARVIDFFRRAHAAGRMVLPLMNKANPAEGFAAARRQLADFRNATGLGDAPCFAVPYAPDAPPGPGRPIVALDGGKELRAYLDGIDIPALKRRVYRDTVARVLEQAGALPEAIAGFLRRTAQIRADWESRTLRAANRYDPAPGPAVGGLFHEYVQSKRGPTRRAIGKASVVVARGASVVGRTVREAFLGSAMLEAAGRAPSETELHERHRHIIERIAREHATELTEASRTAAEPLGSLLRRGLADLNPDAAAADIVKRALVTENISEAFRAHARTMLDRWWYEHQERRQLLMMLDTALAVVPAAIAVPLSLYTGGIGVPEAMVVAGPLMEQVVARVIEYQFGDALFDFLSPWREEQRAALRGALQAGIAEPVLAAAAVAERLLGGEDAAQLKRTLDQCRTALQAC